MGANTSNTFDSPAPSFQPSDSSSPVATSSMQNLSNEEVSTKKDVSMEEVSTEKVISIEDVSLQDEQYISKEDIFMKENQDDSKENKYISDEDVSKQEKQDVSNDKVSMQENQDVSADLESHIDDSGFLESNLSGNGDSKNLSMWSNESGGNLLSTSDSSLVDKSSSQDNLVGEHNLDAKKTG